MCTNHLEPNRPTEDEIGQLVTETAHWWPTRLTCARTCPLLSPLMNLPAHLWPNRPTSDRPTFDRPAPSVTQPPQAGTPCDQAVSDSARPSSWAIWCCTIRARFRPGQPVVDSGQTRAYTILKRRFGTAPVLKGNVGPGLARFEQKQLRLMNYSARNMHTQFIWQSGRDKTNYNVKGNCKL